MARREQPIIAWLDTPDGNTNVYYYSSFNVYETKKKCQVKAKKITKELGKKAYCLNVNNQLIEGVGGGRHLVGNDVYPWSIWVRRFKKRR